LFQPRKSDVTFVPFFFSSSPPVYTLFDGAPILSQDLFYFLAVFSCWARRLVFLFFLFFFFSPLPRGGTTKRRGLFSFTGIQPRCLIQTVPSFLPQLSPTRLVLSSFLLLRGDSPVSPPFLPMVFRRGLFNRGVS